MGDINSVNRELHIKRQNHAKLVALSQIAAREIRMMELDEEKKRCAEDIESQKGVIKKADETIALQEQEAEKDKAEGGKTDNK